MADVLPCPLCGTPVQAIPDDRPASFPFCTARCRQRDLGRWLSNAYVVPETNAGLGSDHQDAHSP